MKQPKAIHDLFLFEDDLFRNEPCAGMGQNILPKRTRRDLSERADGYLLEMCYHPKPRTGFYELAEMMDASCLIIITGLTYFYEDI